MDNEAEILRARMQQLVYAIAHDLQEPLRMVMSYLSLINKRYGEKLDPEVIELMDFSVDGAKRMTTMIEGLLTYSRIESEGRDFAAVELKEALADLLEDEAVTCDALPAIQADEKQIHWLFNELIHNAKTFCKDTPKVQITVEETGDSQRFAVSDNGIGIPEKFRESVFEIFRHLHTREEYPGDGMGLPICQRIAERHGGSITIDANADGGTVVYVDLPTQGPREK